MLSNTALQQVTSLRDSAGRPKEVNLHIRESELPEIIPMMHEIGYNWVDARTNEIGEMNARFVRMDSCPITVPHKCPFRCAAE
jgi:hypothetical protein